ncbi:hypothetical protein BVJ53_04690 [Lacticaseibacillus chiayiensis]|uniref:Uncharacterized protein n=1 Tax=Lacticaseibacillus chiayiensis TaxID=2100821 RepID=A0A4Q1U605_9LACO|nr:hypothetical protein [Lacticaseibacillus chiayiensis]QVI35028.1 hypothetical protein KG086_01410 [Lacticaseibacillus chiayiensis]RXT27044.1 hypothetical protein BVJ53_04690 [Lacticaseibacillus chiayiensis]UYN56809.1 hypothetical protein OFW50_01520 [Lacticaseibacillus chiayiensis]
MKKKDIAAFLIISGYILFFGSIIMFKSYGAGTLVVAAVGVSLIAVSSKFIEKSETRKVLNFVHSVKPAQIERKAMYLRSIIMIAGGDYFLNWFNKCKRAWRGGSGGIKSGCHNFIIRFIIARRTKKQPKA